MLNAPHQPVYYDIQIISFNIKKLMVPILLSADSRKIAISVGPGPTTVNRCIYISSGTDMRLKLSVIKIGSKN